ncbi:hypothetical protein DWB77_01888 [Streptomyces hundungensis]|uniref:Uncharacterized protein n=1 Tax=Streptomyces hundungensis TaxID=1077946 RepID=A0A387HFS0_9ACTN|nr:hypothetical protein DWB77_01888 [Streptomyces hundungensis]
MGIAAARTRGAGPRVCAARPMTTRASGRPGLVTVTMPSPSRVGDPAGEPVHRAGTPAFARDTRGPCSGFFTARSS